MPSKMFIHPQHSGISFGYILNVVLTLLLLVAETTGFVVPVPVPEPVITEAPDLNTAALYRKQVNGEHTCGYTSGDIGAYHTSIKFFQF